MRLLSTGHRFLTWSAALASIGFACKPRPSANTAVAAPTTTALPRKQCARVADQYIVTLKQGQRSSAIDARLDAVIAELLRRYGGELVHVYRHTIRGFVARLTTEQARTLAKDPLVACLDEDGTVTLQDEQVHAPWGLDRIDQRTLPLSTTYSFDSTGHGVHVYVIDSGIRVTHSEFGDRASLDHVSVDDGFDASDGLGHGTHVAGIIGGASFGVAKQVQLHSVRVFEWDCNTAPTSAVLDGVDWVTEHHQSPAIVNMSLGQIGKVCAMEEAITASMAAGVSYVVAAGNHDAVACEETPAFIRPAITVASVDQTDRRAATSNKGDCVDLFAPGAEIRSASNQDDTSAVVKSGTSMAAPHVTGIAARYVEQHPSVTPSELAQALTAMATPVVKDSVGAPNLLAFAFSAPQTCHLRGLVHLKGLGDRPLLDQAWAGTRGERRRLEGFQLDVDSLACEASLEYRCHLEGSGESAWLQTGQFCGTRGEGRRLEELTLRLTRPETNRFQVYTSCYVTGIGDQGPVLGGSSCGTRDQSRSLEAINVWLTRKSLPLSGVVHIADSGDRSFKNDELVGVRGSSRLEGFQVALDSAPPGLGLEYSCHVAGLGDLPVVPGGQYCGTRGQSRSLEGFAIRLTGPQAASYDVHYLCHPRGLLDQGPFQNGTFCGTRHQGRPLESIFVWLSPKP